MPIPLLLLIVPSCITSSPVASCKPSNNSTYTVDYLFEHDGCKIYRIIVYRHGNTVYFTNCRSDVTSISGDSTKKRLVNLIEMPIDDH